MTPLPDRPPFDLIVFDLDGTLIDSLPVTFFCFQEALEPALGRRPGIEEIRSRFGPSEEQIFAAWLGREPGREAASRLHRCYEQHLYGLEPFPGTRELLIDLQRAGVKTGLFTGRGRDSTERILEATDLYDLLDATVTGDEVDAAKPAPDGLLLIAGRTGAALERTLYVGDSPLDHAAAVAAGAEGVLVTWASAVERGKAPGARTLPSVSELRRLALRGRPGGSG